MIVTLIQTISQEVSLRRYWRWSRDIVIKTPKIGRF